MKIVRSLLLLACLMTPAACTSDEITSPRPKMRGPSLDTTAPDTTNKIDSGPVIGSGH